MDSMTSAVIELAEKHLGDFKIRNGQIVAKICPFCRGGNSHDLDTFAVGMHNGAYCCKRGSCNKTGSFKDLCDYFGVHHPELNNLPKIVGTVRKTYEKPNIDDLKPLTEDIITYFAIRKISEQTLNDFRISSDENGNIVFPFFRNNELTYVKYRKAKKHTKADGPKEWSMRNTEPILFGMDNIAFNKPLIITEGQIDAMSLYEAGCTNVVSVPCGCNNMEWINLCWDWLESFSQIIIFGDSDEPGIEMCNTLMKRLGEDRCMIPKEYPELIVNGQSANRSCKDANEILYCYGPETLKSIVDACEPAPIKGVLNLASVQFVDPTTMPRIYTRIPELDNMIGGFGEGSLTVISGKRGQGKSTIGGTFILNAVQQNLACCIYSGELNAHKVFEWICCQATESKYIETRTDPRSGKVFAVVPKEIQERVRKWIDNKLFLFDNAYVDDCTQADAILRVFTTCAQRYGCKMFLCDNAMSALVSADEETKAQAKFAAALKNFSVKFKACTLLVAHPRKTKQGESITNDDVSGSSAITNLADNVLCIERPNIRVLKNRDFGTTGYIVCNYDPCNRRIFQANTGDRTVYNWDHEGIEIPENQACKNPNFEIQTGAPEGASILPF